jgi:hypothetical protein
MPYSPEVIGHVYIALKEIEAAKETGESNVFTAVQGDPTVQHMLTALQELAVALRDLVQSEPSG